MLNPFQKKRNKTKGILFFAVFLSLCIQLFYTFTPSVYATQGGNLIEAVVGASEGACVAGGPTPVPCPPKGILNSVKATWSNVIYPGLKVLGTKALIDMLSIAANKAAYEGAILIANGGPGKGSMFYDKPFDKAMADVGDQALGQVFSYLSDATQLAIGLNLCAPPDPMIRLNLQLSIQQSSSASKFTPRCDWKQIKNAWGQIATDAQALYENDITSKDHYLYKKLAAGLKPGSNELGATIGILGYSWETAQKKAEQEKAKQLFSIPNNKFTDVTDLVTGKTKTPSAMLAKKLDKQLEDANGDQTKLKPGDILANGDVWWQLLAMTGSTFTNTLLSQLSNRIYSGLFDPKPDNFDPFKNELAGGSSNQFETTKADLAGIFTATPISNNKTFDVLSEFTQCVPDGSANRSLNQCVMDSAFASALSRSGGIKELTLKEALDQNILNGDWPLISSQNVAANQDRLCYTYGFCHGNLMKLRKARIIPIGWEIAAEKQDVANPLSLRQVMESFNDCNSNGQMDAGHKWCHLIDPNWVLKAPETQCRALVNGEIRVSPQAPGRLSTCVDAPSCIGEDNNGNCTQGFGYCVEEKNIWRVRGDVCPAHYATCLSFHSTTSGKDASYLLNTVDNGICSKENAGCAWYKTQKRLDTKATADTKDDSFEWSPIGDKYIVAERSDDLRYQISSNTTSDRAKFGGFTTSTTAEYSSYSYEDRLYVTKNAKSCSEEEAGCTELNLQNTKSGIVSLNLVQNSSFEKDDDKDGIPDGWQTTGTIKTVSKGDEVDGSKSIQPEGTGILTQFISVTPGNSYTFSVFAKSDIATNNLISSVKPLDKDGKDVSVAGLSYSDSTCEIVGNAYFFKNSTLSNTDNWKRYICTISLPSNAAQLRIQLVGSSQYTENVRYDGIQLEPGEVASSIRDGYGPITLEKKYLKIAPAYLGCKGLSTDPKECDKYARVCSAQDVGCNMYAPESGPSIPAIASAIDQCPNACVGYDAYRQEETLYEPAKFPVAFIASTAKSCSAVGCDGFTQLDAKGGESKQYFSRLRACLTGDMSKVSPNVSSTYFTWEGSDTNGYQLQTWQLLQSNVDGAPCIKPNVTNETTVVCEEAAHTANDSTWTNDPKCSIHADIFTEPDCREFFDKDGVIHYRRYSQTVSVDNACTPYRKDNSTNTDCKKTGGYWTPQGFCRYFALPKESNSCSQAENGCRLYTGGAGRNATTRLNELFESGNAGGFTPLAGVNAIPSNDSVSSGGHSLLVSGGSAQIQSLLSFVNPNNHNDVCATDAGCNVSGCTVLKGESSCGTLVPYLKKGKVYTLQFWAKGTGNLLAGFIDEPSTQGIVHDFVDSTNLSTKAADLKSISLQNTWKTYKLGPIDTSKPEFSSFSKNSVLTFAASGSKSFNIDNIQLIESEENIALIKDSWVTPQVCDQTPDGIASPQYYLGCKMYTNQKNESASYYQFSHMCSEKALGCSGYFNTQNSNSPYGKVTNARCYNGDPAEKTTGTHDIVNGGLINTKTPLACKINGTEFCTIPNGQSYCVFSANTTFADPLPMNATFRIAYGPETVVTPQDNAVYVIDDGVAECSVAAKGCREVGLPKYAQDQKTVDSFESIYVVDNPEDYKNMLCENLALHCDEYSTPKNGNFYFKDPLNKTCEYKTSANVGEKSMSGWFRSGTTNPCYFTDKADAKGNKNGKYDIGEDAYLISGEVSQIWKNGDTKVVGGIETQYDGWVGACESSANRCTELIDATDTSPENYGNGKSYYVVYNEKLTGDSLVASEKCEGKVSQKEGCALFNNTTDSQLTYSTSSSYMLSEHADLLLENKSKDSLVDPVRCSLNEGTYKISQETMQKIGAPTQSVNLCTRRCAYTLKKADDKILTPFAQKDANGTTVYERSCLFDTDCPVLESLYEKDLKGVCSNTNVPLTDDANTVLKVGRDRACGAWLACNSSRTAWDSASNKYIQICDSVNVCTQSGGEGTESKCTAWNPKPRAAVTMSAERYASRDTSWAGVDYSGYEIPNQLPVEKYSQFNLNPKKWCVDGNGQTAGEVKSCETSSDCTVGTYTTCKEAKQDFRLVFNAGPCDSKTIKTGGECRVGVCSGSKSVCGVDKDCPGNETCVTGYCEELESTVCSNDAACTTGTKKCNVVEGKCIKSLTADDGDFCAGVGKFVLAETSHIGKCYQNRCLTNIKDENGDGIADPAHPEKFTNTQSCRGYPEIDSPLPQKVVKKWKVNDLNQEGKQIQSIEEVNSTPVYLSSDQAEPVQFISGFNDSRVCSPIKNASGKFEANDDCMCGYTKAVFGKGTETKYYPIDQTPNDLTGICVGGKSPGTKCSISSDCGDAKDGGMCQLLTSTNAMYGWKGYCLEKDTSIQLYGSPDSGDRACLTWLPVDQLSGATDLYGKDMSAGYPLKNTYYCAEPGVAWDLGTTGVACAAYVDGNLSEDCCGVKEVKDNFNSGDAPWKSVYCPKGYYPIMGPAGEPGPNKSSTDSSPKYCPKDKWSDDGYPYFCVPKNSFHKDGQSCLSPDQLGSADELLKINFGNAENSSGERVFIVMGSTFDSFVTHYADCKEYGVMGDKLKTYFGADDPYNIPAAKAYDDGIFYDGAAYDHFKINATPYAACQKIVQTAKTGTEGSLNAAFTDNVWQNKKIPFVLDEVAKEYFGFTAKTANPIFGQANETASFANGDKDAYPDKILMCGNTVPKADGTCPVKGQTATTPNQARAFASFTIGKESGATGTKCNNDTECNPTLAKDVCKNNSCTAGTNKDKKCGSNIDCYDQFCYLPEAGQGFEFLANQCIKKDAKLDALVVNGYSVNDAKKRMQKIFASSYELKEFVKNESETDDFYKDITTNFSTNFWKWDDRASANGENPPVVTSLGACIGTSCKEGKNNAFSVNSKESGDVQGLGSKHVNLAFYVHADKNQMPLRKVVVDWGDDMKNVSSEKNPWPMGSRGGSDAESNFYKNHRGLSLGGKQICSADATTFGESPEACSASYVLFNHDYVCTESDIKTLTQAQRFCKTSVNDKTGSIETSPCVDEDEKGAPVCVFQPRVHAIDNWGWCTGYCDANPAGGDSTTSCFGTDECNIQQCPGETGCKKNGKTADPWTYFDGTIRIKPAQ